MSGSDTDLVGYFLTINKTSSLLQPESANHFSEFVSSREFSYLAMSQITRSSTPLLAICSCSAD